MDTAEKERTVAQIICGDVSATVSTKDDTFLSLFLHPPTPREQAKAATTYSFEYQKSILKGLLSSEEIIDDMITLGQWSHQKNIEIEGLQDDIHKLRRGLLDFLFNRTKLEKVRAVLRNAESALLERLSNKHGLTRNSAEAYALNCQQRYLISCITEREDGSSFWKTKKDFDDFEDVEIITQLSEFFFMRSHFSTKVIRELARSQQWRSYWEISKNTNDLFDGSVSRWSWNQIELAYWSTIYDSVYDSYERPSRDIIDDDDLMDSWFIRQGEKSDKKTQTNTVSQPQKSGRNEEFVLSDKEGARRVYNMNDPGTRAQIKVRQRILSREGSVKEQDMPDSQRAMRQQMMERQKKHIKDIRHR